MSLGAARTAALPRVAPMSALLRTALDLAVLIIALVLLAAPFLLLVGGPILALS